LWQITREVQAGGEVAYFRRKKTCASAQAGARDEYETVPRILTNQYLWDLDCGCWQYASPARKRKGMSLSATRCEKYRLLLHVEVTDKKNLRMDAGWCNSC
jgi:hypothetical protein